jgi:hypothetical protein
MMIKFAQLCHIITNRFNDYEDAVTLDACNDETKKKVLLVIDF